MTKLDRGIHIDAMTFTRSRPALIVVVLVSLGLIFKLDQATGAAPIQHLYYLPIVIAGVWLPRHAGLMAGSVAVVLYHLANPILLAARYREADVFRSRCFSASAWSRRRSPTIAGDSTACRSLTI